MGTRILDAGAFYAGVPFGSTVKSHTTSQVYEEIRHIKQNHDALGIMLDTGRLRIRDPDEASIGAAKTAARRTGDIMQLSRQDISIIALGIEMNGDVVTDDFAISNVARSLGLKVSPVMTRGITDDGRWIHYCPGCRTNHTGTSECPACGTRLKRKLLKGSPSKRGPPEKSRLRNQAG